jgi:pantetheine-phosphate adenylyltransferase
MTAIFVGSFDPFTIAHQSLVMRVLPIFSKIVIGVGVNVNKKTMFSVQERVSQIQEVFADNSKVKVESYDGLTIDFAKKHQAQYIVRGVRSVIDFEYERTIADANRAMSGIETIFLFSEPENAYISSSLVRELISHNKSVKHLLPQ